MSDLSKLWKERKSVAENLYKLGLKQKIDKAKKELSSFELKPEMEKLNKLSKYPLTFDMNLSKQLDTVHSLYNISEPTDAQDKERRVAASAAQVTIGHYIRHVKQKEPQIAQVDYEILPLLTNALTKMSSILETYKSKSKGDMQYMLSDVPKLATDWKSAKKKSEEAHKKLVKDPRVVIMLKGSKLGTSYPFKFDKNLSGLIDTLYKDMSGMKKTVPDSASKVCLVANSYLDEIRVVRKKYDSAKIGDAPARRDIFDELFEPLEQIVNRVTPASKPLKV